MARIAIVELQTVASDENFASSVRDLFNDELTVMRGGGGHEEKEKEDDEEKKKKYCPCPPPPCHPCHP
jgi:hypothetical protein